MSDSKNTIVRILIMHTAIEMHHFNPTYAEGVEIEPLIVLDENEDIKVWNVEGITQPTKAELAAVDLSTHQAVREPLDQRRRAYPNWRNQMDMIYHDMKEGTTTHKDAIEAIKKKYPKG